MPTAGFSIFICRMVYFSGQFLEVANMRYAKLQIEDNVEDA